jgi:hypothetical protein
MTALDPITAIVEGFVRGKMLSSFLNSTVPSLAQALTFSL